MNIQNIVKGLAMISTLGAVAGLGQTAAAAPCLGFPDDTRGVNVPILAQGLDEDPNCADVISLHSVDANPKAVQASLRENPTDNTIRVTTEATSNGVPVCSVSDSVEDIIDPPVPCDTPLPLDGMIINMEHF